MAGVRHDHICRSRVASSHEAIPVTSRSRARPLGGPVDRAPGLLPGARRRATLADNQRTEPRPARTRVLVGRAESMSDDCLRLAGPSDRRADRRPRSGASRGRAGHRARCRRDRRGHDPVDHLIGADGGSRRGGARRPTLVPALCPFRSRGMRGARAPRGRCRVLGGGSDRRPAAAGEPRAGSAQRPRGGARRAPTPTAVDPENGVVPSDHGRDTSPAAVGVPIPLVANGSCAPCAARPVEAGADASGSALRWGQLDPRRTGRPALGVDAVGSRPWWWSTGLRRGYRRAQELALVPTSCRGQAGDLGLDRRRAACSACSRSCAMSSRWRWPAGCRSTGKSADLVRRP